MVSGRVVIAISAGAVLLFMAGVALVGQDARQEYRVASKGDTERTQLALTEVRLAWLEHTPRGWDVLGYDMQSKKRTTWDTARANASFPALLSTELAAWVRDAAQGRQVVVHEPGANRTLVLLNDTVLPGRALAGRTLLVVAATPEGPALRRVDLDAAGEARVQPLKLASAARILDGSTAQWDPAAPSSPLLLDGDTVWWWANATIFANRLDGTPIGRPFDAGGRVLSLDADGDTVVWAEDQGRFRRVHFLNLANGTRGEVSTFPGDQHTPAVNGSRVILVQGDGLVRYKDLASGEERVLPARTQENIGLRLGSTHAAWLSGTIEGHNVLVVPVGG